MTNLNIFCVVKTETEYGAKEHQEIKAMFPERWMTQPGFQYAYTQQPPTWRATARTPQNKIIGNVSLVDLNVNLVGIADWVTSPPHQNMGVANQLGYTIVEWAHTHQYNLLVDTENKHLRKMLYRWGFNKPTSEQVTLTTQEDKLVPPGWLLYGNPRKQEVSSTF